MFNTRAPHQNRAIQRRREEEDHRSSLQAAIKSDFRLSTVAQWETQKDKVAERSKLKQDARRLTEQEEGKIQARRDKLKLLLASDEERWKEELAVLEETPEEKAQRMVRRAKEYQQVKETKRAAFAEEQYYRRWRAENDEVRPLDSQKRLFATYAERDAQVLERSAQDAARRAEDERLNAEWRNGKGVLDGQNATDKDRREKILQETKVGLLQQLQDVEDGRLRAKRERESEIARLTHQLQQDTEDNERRLAQKARENDIIQAEIRDVNDAIQRRKAEERARDRREAKEIVQNAIEAHEEDQQAELHAKLQLRSEQAAYKEYLDHRKVEQAQLDHEIERLTQLELDKVNHKREQAKQKEEEARHKLLCQVNDGRLQQLSEKERQRQLALQEKEADRRRVEADLQAMEEERQVVERRRLQDALERQNLFRSQMDEAQARKVQLRRNPEPVSTNPDDLTYRERLQHEVQAASAAAGPRAKYVTIRTPF